MALAMTLEPPTTQAAPSAQVTGPLRTCIVTGETLAPERMIRFVVGPSMDGGAGDAVPDLARRLPGRGMWLRAERAIVEQAIAKKAFARAARAAVKAAPDLPQRIERLLLDRVLEDLSRARRAGRAVAGFVKVEQMVGQRRAGLLIVTTEADGDGLGKLEATGVAIERLGDAALLGGIFGRDRAVYVAVARDDASGQFIHRIASGAARWRRYHSNGAG